MKKLFLLLAVLLILSSCQNNFNKDEWMSNPEDRHTMLNNLIKSHNLMDMTQLNSLTYWVSRNR